jgi:hypothetical protein
MTAALRTCTECRSDFYGRADAVYCSTACRQKAYRARTRNVTPIRNVTGGPVPVGDDWMDNRFSDLMGDYYSCLAAVTAHIEATYKTDAARRKRIAEAEESAARTIRDYVDAVAAIARYDDNPAGEFDYTTALGDSLPARVDPDTAAELGAKLHAAMPRLWELGALLDRRARE